MESEKALELQELETVNGGMVISGTVTKMMKIINRIKKENQDKEKQNTDNRK